MENYKKKYEEIIENIKEAKERMGGYTFSSVVDKIIPELKKGEDDIIKEEILSYIKSSGATTNRKWIAWLEKQSEPQVRTGSEWVRTIDNACEHRYAEEYAHGEYCHQQSFRWGFQEGVDWLERQCEQKPADKVEPKFKVGDIIKHKKQGFTYKITAVMKANAPEKIYILPHKDYSDRRIMNAFTEKEDSEGIEYTRTDAFIEKACEWLEKNIVELTGIDSYDITESFKQAMKEKQL